ncbi:hypothetical protein LTR85_001703 [Meristemomyces frigidus]|nr:hypothetical protein LTR85_001703 [Meristemomyces frigidus]
MNIFRILADLSHLLSVLILIHKMRRSSSASGISFKSQFLYLVVYLSRYLDLFWTNPTNNLWNTFFKIVFIASQSYIVYLMLVDFKPTHDPNQDTFKVEYLLGGALVLGIILPPRYQFTEMLWAFSIWLESVAILPQLFMLQRTGEAETITTHYLFALGAYRALYIPNWIYRYFVGEYVEPIAVVAGIVQTVLYSDFFYIYWTKVLQGKKFNLPDKSNTAAHSETVMEGRTEQTCSFFRLPAELRNQIYRELLLFNRTCDINGPYGPLAEHTKHPKGCWLSIITTCRQAHAEGNGILYGDNEFVVGIHLQAAKRATSRSRVRGSRERDVILRVHVLGRAVHFTGDSIRVSTEDWPNYLFRARQIRLVITFSKVAGGRHVEVWLTYMNQAIYSLHGFLLGRGQVEKVTVDLHSESQTRDCEEMLLELISPARLMAPKIEVTITGVSEETARSITTATTPAPKPPGSIDKLLQKAIELREEGLLRLAFFDRLCGIAPEYAAIKTLIKMLDSLVLDYGPMTVERDSQLERIVRKLDERLQEAGIEDVTASFVRVKRDYERTREMTQARAWRILPMAE